MSTETVYEHKGFRFKRGPDGKPVILSMPRDHYNRHLRAVHESWLGSHRERYAPLSEVREWLSPPVVWINEQENARVAASLRRY